MLLLTRQENRSLRFTVVLAAIVLIALLALSPTIKRLGEIIAGDPLVLLSFIGYLLIAALWIVTAEHYERHLLDEPSDLRQAFYGTVLVAFMLAFWYAFTQIANVIKFQTTNASGASGLLILITTGLLFVPQLIRATWADR